MLVSHSKKFIYLKTRKTASTSVELALERYAHPPGWVRPEGDPFPTEEKITFAGIIGARGRLNKPGSRYFDHAPAVLVRKHVGRPIWGKYFKFCVVRNPWDKTVSLFHHAVRRSRQMEADEAIALFRRWLINKRMAKGTDTNVYYLKSRPALDDYIAYGNLEGDLARICARLQIQPDHLGQFHSGFRKGSVPYTAYYDDRTRRWVEAKYEGPIADFGWEFDAPVPGRLPKPPAEKRAFFQLSGPALYRRLFGAAQ